MSRLPPRRLWQFFDSMMRADTIGLYVHIPFCVRKCNYCDFCSFPYASIRNPLSYIDALCDEIRSYSNKHICIDTVFFGGGTPSLLSTEYAERIFCAIKDSFIVSEDAEITMEINPGTLTEEKARGYIALGVNRFSIGLQTIHDKELKKLGRIHLYSDFLDSYKLLRSFGATNISVDLMYGIPDQTRESFLESVRCVCELAPEHISVYGLILEEGTDFWNRKDALNVPSEDEECDMYFDALSILTKYGYEHYEISNYAMPNKRSRHNMKYWRAEEYIGVGLAAHSYYNGERYGNTTSMERYILGNRVDNDTRESVGIDVRMYEYVMLALRLSDGFSLDEYKTLFGADFPDGREDEVERLIKLGYARIENGRFFLTDKGLYVSNSIICSLV